MQPSILVPRQERATVCLFKPTAQRVDISGQIDDGSRPPHGRDILRIEDNSAARCDDSRWTGDDLFDDPLLFFPEPGFPVLAEDLRDRRVLGLFNQLVRVVERPPEVIGDEATTQA